MAKSTVERLMSANGWREVSHTRKVRTTVADPSAHRAPDLVKRRLRVEAPNRLLVADFTMCDSPTPGGSSVRHFYDGDN